MHDMKFLARRDKTKKIRPFRAGAGRVILWVVGIGVTLWALALAIAAGSVLAEARNTRDALVSAKQAALDLRFTSAQTYLEQARFSTTRIQKGLTVLNSIRWVPV
ncbi:MAG: hypothetical protein Q8R07_04420, partial [Candidatus Uhrbacteria bacterium]|nr:hypothetical protein [Candidatus Uhrbacteria bacterium]